jgi:hypothetical protein
MKEDIAGNEKNGAEWVVSVSSLVCTMEFSGTWCMTLGPSHDRNTNKWSN